MVATTIKKAARAAGAAMGLVEYADPHKEARDKLRTPADLEAAEAEVKRASAALAEAKRQIADGTKWQGYERTFVLAANAALAELQACKSDLQKRRDLAPQELQDKRREAKRQLIEATTLVRELEDTKPDLEKSIRDAKESVVGREQVLAVEKGLAEPPDPHSVLRCESDLRAAKYRVAQLETEFRSLVAQLDDAKATILKSQSEYDEIDAAMLTV